MRYHLYPNVSLEEICGVHLLIASGEARTKFEYVRVINTVAADIITAVLKEQETDEIVKQLSYEYEMKVPDIESGVLGFLREMETKGYLIPIRGGI